MKCLLKGLLALLRRDSISLSVSLLVIEINADVPTAKNLLTVNDATGHRNPSTKARCRRLPFLGGARKKYPEKIGST